MIWGSYSYIPGQWMTFEERVKLNTPGELDGKFMLFVDGNLVIDLDDVNYRQWSVIFDQIGPKVGNHILTPSRGSPTLL